MSASSRPPAVDHRVIDRLKGGEAVTDLGHVRQASAVSWSMQANTHTCIDWLRTLPYLRAWADRYTNYGLTVIGVHTPEFDFEHDLDNVRREVKDLGSTIRSRSTMTTRSGAPSTTTTGRPSTSSTPKVRSAPTASARATMKCRRWFSNSS